MHAVELEEEVELRLKRLKFEGDGKHPSKRTLLVSQKDTVCLMIQRQPIC